MVAGKFLEIPRILRRAPFDPQLVISEKHSQFFHDSYTCSFFPNLVSRRKRGSSVRSIWKGAISRDRTPSAQCPISAFRAPRLLRFRSRPAGRGFSCRSGCCAGHPRTSRGLPNLLLLQNFWAQRASYLHSPEWEIRLLGSQGLRLFACKVRQSKDARADDARADAPPAAGQSLHRYDAKSKISLGHLPLLGKRES